MLDKNKLRLMAGFYENELVNHFLFFWDEKCIDREYGGYLNCFDNRGEHLLGTDKFTWSQGRFIWIFSKLATLEAPIFSVKQREQFLEYAKNGVDFVMRHCLVGEDDWRCTFLMDRQGKAKLMPGYDFYDIGIAADAFIVAGLSRYVMATGDKEVYSFAKNLYQSIDKRERSGQFYSHPYPISSEFQRHGTFMTFGYISNEIYLAAQKVDPGYCKDLQSKTVEASETVLNRFVDENYLLREVVDGKFNFIPKVIGMHINPGHTIEDAWFLLDSAKTQGHPEWNEKIYKMVEKALEVGWDRQDGGVLHFADLRGGEPRGDNSGYEQEVVSRQLAGWKDKLWWIHSESLYSSLRCFFETGDERFYQWYEKVFDYAFSVFPNTDPEVREWIQIRDGYGKPEEKVVALPVKDPYHIIRNFSLIIELIYRQME